MFFLCCQATYKTSKNGAFLAVEQVALSLTTDWIPANPYYDDHGHSGPSEQRTGWILDEVIPLMDDLCDEVVALDWESFLQKYQLL